MIMKFPLFATVLAALLILPARGDGTERLLTTVGTTVQDGATTRAYILWQPGDAVTTLGKRFAIYAKNGDAASPAGFSRLGIQTLQTSPNTIRALLELGAKLDPQAAAANIRIDGIYRDVTLQSSAASAAADDSLDAAGKLAYLIQSAVSDPRLLSRMFFLGRAHPGVMQVLGHAFSIPVASGVQTYEIREIDSAENDVQVIGRVTLDTSSPVVPAAPASPVQVFHPVKPGAQYPINPKDNLNARLRWGVDATLRAQMPHTFGFDIFRVRKSVAEGLGWQLTPPSPEVMLGALAAHDPADPDPDIARANDLPILVTDFLTPAEAANPADQKRIDFADDGVWHIGEDGKSVRRPYADGESYYYFVAARTITGRPGLLSPGSLVQMCDRLPPHPPSIFTVRSSFVRPTDPAAWASQGGSQFLRLRIRQLAEGVQAEEAIGYYVYRWDSSQEYLKYAGNPAYHRIGVMLAHDPGKPFITFDDNGAGAPTLADHANRSVWYTVRAVGRSACSGQVLSGQSAPVAGVLRDFKAPDGPTGSYLVCRTVPSAAWLERVQTSPENHGLPADFEGITIQVTRDTPLIAGAEIEVSAKISVDPKTYGTNFRWLPLHRERLSYQLSNSVAVNLPYREPASEAHPLRISVRAIAANGLVSAPAEKVAYSAQSPAYVIHRFTATATIDCVDIASANPPVHESADADGTVNIIHGSISFATGQGVREWRVYRRIGHDGELSLIAKAEGDSIPNPGTWQDDALPAASGVSVCYYGQIFDQNANPSPLVPLGCTTMVNSNLPTPMMAPAKITSTSGDRITVHLEWFCDPVGVDRFEVLSAVEGGGIPDLHGLSEVLDDVPATGISSAEPGLEFYPFQTPRLGGSVGDGPGFGLDVSIPAANRAYFAVRACSAGVYPRGHGSVSNVVTARWQPQASGPQPVIPWPARPLPGSFENRRNIGSYAIGEGPLWPLIPPTGFGFGTAVLVGITRHPLNGNPRGNSVVLDSPETPKHYLFHLRESADNASATDGLLPLMLYRYQLPSAKFPTARANLVQCTPLIDRISWKPYDEGKGHGYVIRDPFLLFVSTSQSGFQIPFSGDWNDTMLPVLDAPSSTDNPPPYLDSATGLILLKDPLPVIQGANYRYLIVQFKERGEIKRIIPLQSIQH